MFATTTGKPEPFDPDVHEIARSNGNPSGTVIVRFGDRSVIELYMSWPEVAKMRDALAAALVLHEAPRLVVAGDLSPFHNA